MADGGSELAGSGDRDDAADGIDPTEVFALLADETRLAIVEELAAVRQAGWQWEGMTFAELRRAVGERDAGNFSYHLEKLVGPLVVKDGDEYTLHNHGVELVGTIESGRYTETVEGSREETDVDCPYPDCDNVLEARYGNQYFRVCCPDHGVYQGTALPPRAVAGRSGSELLSLARLDTQQDIQRARSGACPLCWGPVEATMPIADPDLPAHDVDEIPEEAVFVGFDCENCGIYFETTPGVCVVTHPAVVALYHEHDEDVREKLYTELPFAGALDPVVESEDPVRVRVDVELGGDEVRLWLDEETTVVEYERT